jgi:hypothetical protein
VRILTCKMRSTPEDVFVELVGRSMADVEQAEGGGRSPLLKSRRNQKESTRLLLLTSNIVRLGRPYLKP